MLHLIPVLPGAALMLAGILRVLSDIGQPSGGVHPAHARFILAGGLLMTGASTGELLYELFLGMSGAAGDPTPALAFMASAATVIGAILLVLPRRADDYRDLFSRATADRQAEA